MAVSLPRRSSEFSLDISHTSSSGQASLAYFVTTYVSSTLPFILLAGPLSHFPIPNPYKTAL